MFTENGQSKKIEATVFASKAQLIAQEKAHHKHENYQGIQEVKRAASAAWDLFTRGIAAPAVLISVDEYVQKKSAVNMTKKIFGIKPSFVFQGTGALRAIPADYASDAAQQRLKQLKNRFHDDRTGSAVDVAQHYAEAYYYLATANAAKDPQKENATLDSFIFDAQNVLTAIEGDLNRIQPGVVGDLNHSLQCAMGKLALDK